MLESTQKVADNKTRKYERDVKSNRAIQHTKEVQGIKQKLCQKGRHDPIKGVRKKFSEDLSENACKSQAKIQQKWRKFL